jgi:hypothetical protein
LLARAVFFGLEAGSSSSFLDDTSTSFIAPSLDVLHHDLRNVEILLESQSLLASSYRRAPKAETRSWRRSIQRHIWARISPAGQATAVVVAMAYIFIFGFAAPHCCKHQLIAGRIARTTANLPRFVSSWQIGCWHGRSWYDAVNFFALNEYLSLWGRVAQRAFC